MGKLGKCGQVGQVWASLDKFGQVWAGLDGVCQVWQTAGGRMSRQPAPAESTFDVHPGLIALQVLTGDQPSVSPAMGREHIIPGPTCLPRIIPCTSPGGGGGGGRQPDARPLATSARHITGYYNPDEESVEVSPLVGLPGSLP